jgi:sugar phosphate isomerase/epimerase
MISRRKFFAASAAAVAVPRLFARGGFKVGVTDWNLRLACKPDAVGLAKSLGFEGVEVSLGRKPENDKLPLDNAELQQTYLAEAKKHGIKLAGTCLDILHVNYLKNDKLGQRWLVDGIRITKILDAKVMLMPFFGNGALKTSEEMDYVGDILREIAPQAEKAGIMLGLEDTISAQDNVRIMERSRSKAVKTYYDVGNSTNNGFDIIKEMRWLGAKRICQIHLKDKGYMGEGSIDFPLVIKTMRDIGFEGFANLETSSPSKDIEADMRKNLTYVRKVMAQPG